MSLVTRVVNRCDEKQYLISTEAYSDGIWEIAVTEEVIKNSHKINEPLFILDELLSFEVECIYKEIEQMITNNERNNWHSVYQRNIFN